MEIASTSKENTNLMESEEKADINVVLTILREIQKKIAVLKPDECEEELAKFDELQRIVEKFASLNANNTDSVPSKRRKLSKAVSERKNELEKDLEATKKRINLLRKALAIFYDLEDKNFKYYVKKNKNQRDVISRVNFIQRIMTNAESIPLWVKLDEERPPPLCGAIKPGANYIAKAGDFVAAVEENKEDFILAEVVSYNSSKKQYIVNDVYSQELLVSKQIIPLPKMRADPESCPEGLFQKGERVLALYPDTSAFYPASVSEKPFYSNDPYVLHFENDDYASKEAHQRYVIPKVHIRYV